MLPLDHYLRLRERPKGRPAMFHQWRDLLFLHFAVEPEAVQALLPPGLTVDTFPDACGREMAWVGLVPFRMQGVRLSFLPPVPGTHVFPETNVRTYAHREGRAPGVWFFSLDAASWLACHVARRMFGLPYFHASMKTEWDGERASYRCQRLWSPPAEHLIRCDVSEDLGQAEPGTLEFFLVERYLLYSYKRGALFSGQVHHPPYPLRAATVTSCEESMVRAAEIEPRPWTHVCFSPGVDVEVFSLRPQGM